MRHVCAFATLFVAIVSGNATAKAEVLVGVPAPFAGSDAWGGAEMEPGVDLAVASLNAGGGVLGQEVRVLKVDDNCTGPQAVAAAQYLIDEGVDFVIGHMCSGAAIPASRVYADAGVLMMTNTATNPRLTEQGFSNVFRFCGRDDIQATMAATYLANHWREGNIAILHDGEAFGKGLAEQAKRDLNARGITESVMIQFDPLAVEYTDVVDRLQAAATDAVYYAGDAKPAALILRELRERGDDVQFVAGDGVNSEEFTLMAGDAGDGMLFTGFFDARSLQGATDVVAALRADGLEARARALLTYGAIQAWAQAVEQAGTLDLDKVTEALRTGTFDTIFGRVGFDDKGDVTGYEPFAWYVWQEGEAVPANLTD
jgi:branched-chain amino acid transport system substrate-binding protein